MIKLVKTYPKEIENKQNTKNNDFVCFSESLGVYTLGVYTLGVYSLGPRILDLEPHSPVRKSNLSGNVF